MTSSISARLEVSGARTRRESITRLSCPVRATCAGDGGTARRLLPFVGMLVLAASDMVHAQFANTASCLTADEAELAQRVNDYRAANGLSAIPVSFSLGSVGQWHVWDLTTSNAWQQPGCNLHTWSGQRPALWQAMCYTADHAQAAQMWSKPSQITAGIYTGAGYEISAWSSGTIPPSLAMAVWQGSQGHNDVILNQGGWSAFSWRAMGIGMYGNFAVVWFGVQTDPLGTMSRCSDVIFSSGFDVQ